MKIKKGDNVIVITGQDKGQSGKVARVFPQTEKVLIEGVNKQKKHERARKANSKGQVIERSMPIHVSNVMLLENKKKVRAGFKIVDDKKVRISRKTGQEI